MGKSVEYRQISAAELRNFQARLEAETRALGDCFGEGAFADGDITIGYEVEACLVDANGRPADANMGFLERLNMPDAVPELARSNIELNGHPRGIKGRGLVDMQAELDEWLALGRRAADSMGLSLVAIGILPTLRESDMDLAHISPSPRYRMLNERVAALRGRDTVRIDIDGQQNYHGEFDSIMAESAATSFQLHLSLPPALAAHWYNAAQIVSAPLLAVSANSPYLFGRDLWSETRIPAFAQAVDTGDVHYVTFGDRHVSDFMQLFEDNLQRFAPLLPLLDDSDTRFAHLNLHNGSIWRWNRPIIGTDGPLHLRVEHRALPSGPSVLDMVSNCALFNGLVAAIGSADTPPHERVDFATARANFYSAARWGMDAELQWQGRARPLRALVKSELLPLAREGLARLAVDDDVATRYLDIIAQRLDRGLSGAGWQREWVRLHGADMAGLLRSYIENQCSGRPVAEWEFRRC